MSKNKISLNGKRSGKTKAMAEELSFAGKDVNVRIVNGKCILTVSKIIKKGNVSYSPKKKGMDDIIKKVKAQQKKNNS
jgi:ActR/RegA family two-component response regulator